MFYLHRFANIFSKQLKTAPTAGFGRVVSVFCVQSIYFLRLFIENGANCQYRHALPPGKYFLFRKNRLFAFVQKGFMLKRDRKLLEEQKETISLEELIESERAALGSNVTKVTLESFLAWKTRKIEEKKQQLVKDEEKKRTDFVKHGRLVGLSGREMFTFNPDLIANDDEDADNDIDYKHRSDDEDEEEEEGAEGQVNSNEYARYLNQII